MLLLQQMQEVLRMKLEDRKYFFSLDLLDL